MKRIIVLIFLIIPCLSFAQEYNFDCQKIKRSLDVQYLIIEELDKNYLNDKKELWDLAQAKRIAIENLISLEAIYRRIECLKKK